MAGMIIAHKIGKAIEGVGTAANQSQANLNEFAKSSHAEHSSPGESAPAQSLSHDDQVDHALMTNPETGQPEKGFGNAVASILSKMKGTPQVGSAPGGGSAGMSSGMGMD